MRILVVSPSYSNKKSSAYAFVHARAKIYEKYGDRVEVFVLSKALHSYTYEGIKIISGVGQTYLDLLNEFDPDVVALHSPRHRVGLRFMDVRSLMNMFEKSPVAVWIHGAEAMITALHDYYPPWRIRAKFGNMIDGPLKLIFVRLLASRASALVFVSKWMRSIAERYLLLKHPYSFAIPNPVDTSLFTYTRGNNSSRREGISVRGLDWKYGTDIAVRAYSKLKETRLTILGTGPLYNYIQELAQRCQSNVLLQPIHVEHSEMPHIYSRFGYFVAPSRTEAQGVAMCEAMACGLPIVATSVGGIPEFVKDGSTGILVPPENPSALRGAVRHLLVNEELYDELSENAARYVRGNLSHERIYKEERNVFRLCQETFDAQR